MMMQSKTRTTLRGIHLFKCMVNALETSVQLNCHTIKEVVYFDLSFTLAMLYRGTCSPV